MFDVTSLRGYANDMMSSINIDEPISYSALTGLLIKINVFIFSTWKPEWSSWIRTFGLNTVFATQLRMTVDILAASMNVSYTALYDLGYMLQNPLVIAVSTYRTKPLGRA